MIRIDDKQCRRFLAEDDLQVLEPQVQAALQLLKEGQGAGADFLGWRDLPLNYDREEFARIEAAAARIREDSDVLLVVGIGGSYLGARAVLEALRGQWPEAAKGPEVIFAGFHLSERYHQQLLHYLDGKRVSVNVISKSGTTTEPALAFRLFKHYMEERYGADEAARRIYATTDKARGALKSLADTLGYETFVVPDDVGGRYSVLTAVGLLPIAAAGYDIKALMQGAEAMRAEIYAGSYPENDCLRYAALRNLLYRKGYAVEILANYEPSLHFFAEWWKQLFGESEGKGQRGIFPASVDLTSDLHSMGQYIQEGRRFLMETVIDLGEPGANLAIPEDPADLDGLNFLKGLRFSEVNARAMHGTILAHADGGVPCLRLCLPSLQEKDLGALIYFFEFACGLSAYLDGVNPFNQPGVEAYKKNMFALLGKPGYEALRAELEARL